MHNTLESELPLKVSYDAIYLNMSEHFILSKMPQMLICYVVSAIPRTSLMKICSTKSKRKKEKNIKNGELFTTFFCL